MASVYDLPPEVLAASFEMAIFTWGIRVLGPLYLVCSSWRDIIEHTPRLYGIFVLNKKTELHQHRLEAQLLKAKEAPLSIVCTHHNSIFMKRLTALSNNWVMAELDVSYLTKTSWSVLRHSLQELVLHRSVAEESVTLDNIEQFFKDDEGARVGQQGKLVAFSAISLHPQLAIGLLNRNPMVQRFRLEKGNIQLYTSPSGTSYTNQKFQSISDTWQCFTHLPNVLSIELAKLIHVNESTTPPPPIKLLTLQNLHLDSVQYPSLILSNIAAPNLQTLIIDRKEVSRRFRVVDANEDKQHLAPFFAQWSQPGFLPENLHTLELKDCIEVSDVPYLIRWLDRLTNLVRLTLVDDNVGVASTRAVQEGSDTTNLYRALSQPRILEDGSTRWLCPSLMVLYLDTDQELADVIEIARLRGGRTSPDTLRKTELPKRLRRVETFLCCESWGEVKELESLVDELHCICVNCGLSIEAETVGMQALSL